jgi:hypothetical protein
VQRRPGRGWGLGQHDALIVGLPQVVGLRQNGCASRWGQGRLVLVVARTSGEPGTMRCEGGRVGVA